jgi:hypothetical protein
MVSDSSIVLPERYQGIGLYLIVEECYTAQAEAQEIHTA